MNIVSTQSISLTSELTRTYFWGDGREVTINEPQYMYVSENGHRIVDFKGFGHYIPKGWIHLRWKSREGEAKLIY